MGWGEAFGFRAVASAKLAVDQLIAPLCIGQDATRIEPLMLDVQKKLHVFGRAGALGFGVSAVDIALWDIAGKAAKLPLCGLLGAGAADIDCHPQVPGAATDRAIGRLDRIRWAKGRTGAGEIRLAMPRIMQRHCAMFRTGALLDEGAGKLAYVIAQMSGDLFVADRSTMFNTDLAEALELDNMAGAGEREPALEDRAHRRPRRARARGFPKRDDENWLKHTLWWLDDDGRVRFDYRPVHLQPLSNEVATIPPKERVY